MIVTEYLWVLDHVSENNNNIWLHHFGLQETDEHVPQFCGQNYLNNPESYCYIGQWQIVLLALKYCEAWLLKTLGAWLGVNGLSLCRS